MTSTAAAPSGLAGYVDRKRRLWLFSLGVPMLALVGPLLYVLVSPQVIWLWVSTIFAYVVIPALDAVLGEDLSNPPEEAVPALEADPYYRYVTYALVPILWVSFLVNIIFLFLRFPTVLFVASLSISRAWPGAHLNHHCDGLRFCHEAFRDHHFHVRR